MTRAAYKGICDVQESVQPLQRRNVRHSHQRIIRVIGHESRLAAVLLVQIFSLCVIDLHFGGFTTGRVPGSQRAGFLIDPVRELLFSFSF